MTEYIPNVMNISAISQDGKNSIITFTEDHNFNIGNLIRFVIPSNFNMIQLDGKEAAIIAIDTDMVTVDIDTREFTPFSVPASYYTPAQAVPAGDNNTGLAELGSSPMPIGISGAFRITQN